MGHDVSYIGVDVALMIALHVVGAYVQPGHRCGQAVVDFLALVYSTYPVAGTRKLVILIPRQVHAS